MSELIQMSSNPDEINIASDDEEEEGDEKIEEVELERQMIPSAVFGTVEETQSKMLGAKERLAARKKK